MRHPASWAAQNSSEPQRTLDGGRPSPRSQLESGEAVHLRPQTSARAHWVYCSGLELMEMHRASRWLTSCSKLTANPLPGPPGPIHGRASGPSHLSQTAGAEMPHHHII